MYKIIFYIVLLSGIINSCTNKPSIPRLTETYRRKDKNPFGAYVMHEQVKQMFPDNYIRYKNESFEDAWRYNTDDNSLYFVVTKNLFLSSEDKAAMLDYVSNGNNLFIAAENIGDSLLKEMGCKLSLANYYISEKPLKTTHVTFAKPVSYQKDNYGYFYLPFANYFYNISNPYVQVLANNEHGQPNCIVYFYGKGKLFLHCDPRAFSNYFLLKNNNYQYVTNLFGYVNPNPDYIYWDDYYSGGHSSNKKNFSAFDIIFKHPALKLAFWLVLLLLLLYVLFQGKRRQRIVPSIKPNENTSVTFTETIGMLYLQKKDNYNIAQKMITYFNEHIRNNYFLNTNQINGDFITSLSRKSGIDKSKIESLYLSIQQAQQHIEMPDFELLSLNEKIQFFFVNSKK